MFGVFRAAGRGELVNTVERCLSFVFSSVRMELDVQR